MYDVIIIGGGLAGLSSAIHLSKNGVSVLLLEKSTYPKHKVCGEYVSNEVLDYLSYLEIDVWSHGAKNIDSFAFSDTRGRAIKVALPLGGFGISRYKLDEILYHRAVHNGVDVQQEVAVNVVLGKDVFKVTTRSGIAYTGHYVLGAYGKRSGMDVTLSRKFIQNKTPWIGVKAHYQAAFPENVVALHNFKGGYCGLSQVETGLVNACYLTHKDVFKEYTDLEAFQRVILEKNSELRRFFEEATLAFEKPLTISQISFETKEVVSNNILMIGDSAGLIHPLCGNGMAMAIHSAKIASETLLETLHNKRDRNFLETHYEKKWHQAFDRRLRAGKMIQKVLTNDALTGIGVSIVGKSTFVLKQIIKATHGNPI